LDKLVKRQEQLKELIPEAQEKVDEIGKRTFLGLHLREDPDTLGGQRILAERLVKETLLNGLIQEREGTFATKRLMEWYRTGSNVPLQMPKLTTYLGHSSVACTYWYIEAVPELLELATEFQLTPTQGGRR